MSKTRAPKAVIPAGRKPGSTDESQVINKLPSGWKWTTIGEMCEKPQYGWTTKAQKSQGKIKFLRTTDLSSGSVDWTTVPWCEKNPPNINQYRLRNGDVVISRAGSIGLSALVINPPEAVFASYLIRFRLSAQVNPIFFSYFLQSPSYWTEVREKASGIALQNVNAKKLSSIRFPLAPLDEQNKIVAEIEKQFTRLDAGVSALRRAQANLKRYRAAVLKAACEGRVVPTEAELAKKESRKYETGDNLLRRILISRRERWRGSRKYKEPASSVDEKVRHLPHGWAWATVEQLSTKVQYGSSAKANGNSAGVPVLRMGNIQEGIFNYDSLKYLPRTHNEFPDLLLASGDLLFNRTNSAELVGKAAVYKGAPIPCSFASYLIRVQLAEGCLPDYVNYFINSVFGRAWIAKVVNQQVGQANVNGTKLQALVIPLPPFAEQMRIVAEVERRLNLIEGLEVAVAANLQRVTRLRQAILSQAFKGDLYLEKTLSHRLGV